MKHYPPPTRRPRTAPLHIPAFHAVPVRIRADGWTPVRQAEFIGHLAETRSVAQAARAVSMARETAYRLRGKPGSEGFVAAWDVAMLGPLEKLATAARQERWMGAQLAARAALRPHRKVTIPQLQWRVNTGFFQVIMRGGSYRGVWRKADNPALLSLLARLRFFDDREWR